MESSFDTSHLLEQNNKEAIAAHMAQYYKDNKEAIAAHFAQYHKDNKEAIAAYQEQYHHSRTRPAATATLIPATHLCHFHWLTSVPTLGVNISRMGMEFSGNRSLKLGSFGQSDRGLHSCLWNPRPSCRVWARVGLEMAPASPTLRFVPSLGIEWTAGD